MLGGPIYFAFIRFIISLIGVIMFFSTICESKFSKKRTFLYYLCFGIAMTALSCVWYLVNQPLYVRIGPHIMYLSFALMAFCLSKGSVWLKIYKLVLVFYLMAVFIIAAIEISIFFFEGNIWVDIILRIILICLMAFLLKKYVCKGMEGFGSYVDREADRFSVAVMIICILLCIGYIMSPGLNREVSFSHVFQIAINFFLIGTLQLLVFRFYLHIGKEKEYERENQLIQMNYRLLERQLEILEESVESGRRIRHDARHHNAVIAEYTRRGQRDELLQYLKEYEEEISHGIPEMICANTAVNNILATYTRKARSEDIKVTLDVEVSKNLAFPSLDLVAILANAYENAIYACMELKRHPDGRECFIHLMLRKRKHKIVVSCSNSCRIGTELKDGQPESEFTGGIGVSSIIRTAEKYGGEYDFKNDKGVFLFRLIMNTEPVYREETDTSEWRKNDSSDSAL